MQFLIRCGLLYWSFEKTAINPPADPTSLISNFNLSGFPPSKVILQFEKAPDSRVTDYLKQFHQLEVRKNVFRIILKKNKFSSGSRSFNKKESGFSRQESNNN